MAEKKRIEVFAHTEIQSEGTYNAGTAEGVIEIYEVHGVRGSIQIKNTGSVDATVKVWVSNYKTCENPLTNPDKWAIIDSRTVSAGISDILRISGSYKFIAITALTSTNTTALKYASYFVMGGI